MHELLNQHFHYDVLKYSFTARIVDIWISLADHAVDRYSVYTYDKFWIRLIMFNRQAHNWKRQQLI